MIVKSRRKGVWARWLIGLVLCYGLWALGASNSAEAAPPPAPTGLSATAYHDTRIDLSWTDNSDNEDGFRIERKDDTISTQYTQIATAGADITTYSDTGLTPATTYYYRVRTYNADGDSAWSNEASATTPPAAPSELSATAIYSQSGSSRINLFWVDNSTDEDGFKIERKDNAISTQYTLLDTVLASVITYSDTSVTSNITYNYRVRAYNTDGNSAYSNQANAKLPTIDTIDWVATYNGSGNDDEIAADIAIEDTITGSTYLYVTGASWNGTYYDYITIKYSLADGSVFSGWPVIYDGSGKDDVATALAVDRAGNVYVTGRSWNGSNYDYVTIKYDTIGSQQWVANFNGSGNGDDTPAAIAVYEDTSITTPITTTTYVHVTGISYQNKSGESPGNDYATVKYDDSGNQLWVRTYDGITPWGSGDGNGIDYPTAIAVDNAWNVYVTGFSSGDEDQGTDPEGDYTTIKYNSAGAQQWVARYDHSSGRDEARAIVVYEDTSITTPITTTTYVYVTGISRGGGTFDDYATVKYNASGVEQWVDRYNGSGNAYDEARAIGIDSDGNVYVSGIGMETNSENYVTIKYDPAGSRQWVAEHNGEWGGSDRAFALSIKDTNLATGVEPGVYVTGTSGDNYTNIKYSLADGSEIWTVIYSEGAYDIAKAIDVDRDGNAYIVGLSAKSGTGYDLMTIRDAPSDTSIIDSNLCSDIDGDGYSAEGGDCGPVDCNDTNPSIHPGATELCDGVDNNCDGSVDEGVKNTYYLDTDGDSYGDPSATTQACSAPSGYVTDNTDCDDTDASINPGATEICDGEDNDCDDEVDEGFTDTDGDGEADCVDTDDDNDGVLDGDDNCPWDSNANQLDADGDGVGDTCADSTMLTPLGYVDLVFTEINSSLDTSIIFSQVTEAGYTNVNVVTETELAGTGVEPPTGYDVVGGYYDIETSAIFSGVVDVCIVYSDTGMSEAQELSLELLHFEAGAWVVVEDSSVYTETDTICGQVTSLSIFAIGEEVSVDNDSSGSGSCFIATAAYGTPLANQVQILCRFRDRYLLTNKLGTMFVEFYYRYSPPIARYIADQPYLKAMIRIGLLPLIGFSWLVLMTGWWQKLVLLLAVFGACSWWLTVRLRTKVS